MSGNANHTLGIDWTAVETTPQFTLGELKQDRNGTQYQYVKASAALTVNETYIIPYTYTIASGNKLDQTTDDAAPVAVGVVQHSSFTTSGQYGWIFVGPGVGSVKVLANCAADVPVYSTATAGALDDASASAKLVAGLKLTAANGGSTAAVACYATSKLHITA